VGHNYYLGRGKYLSNKTVEFGRVGLVKGASTSSRRQKGVGFMRNMANMRARAQRAFSQPERRERFAIFFPGNWMAYSTPDSSTFFHQEGITMPYPHQIAR